MARERLISTATIIALALTTGATVGLLVGRLWTYQIDLQTRRTFLALTSTVQRRRNPEQEFACPESHLTFLTKCLPAVRWILVIGWRGMEAHFLEMLKAHLTGDVGILAVCGGAPAGEQTIESLRARGIGTTHEASDAGFSEFVVATEVDAFLERALTR